MIFHVRLMPLSYLQEYVRRQSENVERMYMSHG